MTDSPWATGPKTAAEPIFELTKIAEKSLAGVMKDVVMIGGFQEVEVDFTADNPGLTLFHCHQQLHTDFGFMTLFDYV
jgi:FtsP/CotA-like multicopper oxidase with cupredoxin domain